MVSQQGSCDAADQKGRGADHPQKERGEGNVKKYEIYEEGYEATGERGYAHYVGSAEGETFLDACKNYIARKGYGEIYDGSHFADGKERAGNWGCYWYPTMKEAQRYFG